MGMPDRARTWTREMVLALPDDGNRYELLDGELLVTPAPAPRHQDAVRVVFQILHAYLDESGMAAVYFSSADVQLDGRQYLQPDILVVRTPDGQRPDSWDEIGIPILVIEVSSPSTAKYDRLLKRLKYLRSGVEEYWVVDVDAEVIERWSRNEDRPEVLSERLDWQPAFAESPLVIDLPRMFEEMGRGHRRGSG